MSLYSLIVVGRQFDVVFAYLNLSKTYCWYARRCPLLHITHHHASLLFSATTATIN